MSEKKIQWDDLTDIAYACIYETECRMEREGKCDPDMDTDSLCYECKKLAVEFSEMYTKLSEFSEPDYYEMLDKYAESKILELWPPLKRYDVLIDANVTMTYPVFAKDRKDAEEQAQKFMETPQFDKRFRNEMTIIEREIGDVIEP